MRVKPVTVLTDDVEALIQQSRLYQETIYPPESIHQDDPYKLIYSDMFLVGVYDGEVLCGIGGVKIVDDAPNYGEIKNLFVDPQYRGRGASKAIMSALERHVLEQGVGLCRLETGISQPESINLYHSLGYQYRDAYGDYQADPLSVFMEKALS
ncbi:MAG: GNAT family N-acetyltransferase [Gammaproteobacteria bacterium]|nr:GNAT family N-acetyltransferase [Gammaproteobacteria bacterium]